MAAELRFFDASYLVRLYLDDRGFDRVRQLAAETRVLAASWHAQAEVVAALHRAFREGRFTGEAFRSALDQFTRERDGGGFVWHPLDSRVQARLEAAFRTAPASTFLRAADALHLACAAEHGFHKVFSNDRHFLAAAPHFGLEGVDVMGN